MHVFCRLGKKHFIGSSKRGGMGTKKERIARSVGASSDELM